MSKILDEKGKSENFLKALDKDQTPIYLNEIYKEYLKLCKFNNTIPILYITEVGAILLENSQFNKNSNLQIEWHHQGSTLYANEVFFTKPSETKKDALKRIRQTLIKYDTDKRKNQIFLKKTQAGLKRNLQQKIENMFNATNKHLYSTNDFNKRLDNIIKSHIKKVDYCVIVGALVEKNIF